MSTANLTELELKALQPDVINLSDGHAHQSLGEKTRARIRDLVQDTLSGRPSDYFQAERQFLVDLERHTHQAYPAGRTLVTYASSMAMGVIATHLRRLGRPVGVICPTFDNIPGILATLDVPMVAVPEDRLWPDPDLDHLDRLGIGALILVLPNNPTGRCPSRAAVRRLMDWAACRKVLLVLDLAFRWFDETANWDLIREAEQRGAEAVSIDDTGKVLSFSDLKAAVITTTSGVAAAIRSIHTQYVLNVSELGLRLLSAMMEPDKADNEVRRARDLVAANRRYLDERLAANPPHLGTDLRMTQRNDCLSVEWLSIRHGRDRVAALCRSNGLEILIGDHFHWGGDTAEPRGTHVRLALMRDPGYFARGVDVFVEVLAQHGRERQ